MQNAARICSQNALVSTTLSKRSILSYLNISSVLLLMLLNFPLLEVKFPNWEENFFSDHSLIVDPESSSVELGISTILEVSDCTHNEITNNPSLGPGSALGEKGEKNRRGERNNQRAKRAWEGVWWGERVAFPPPQLHRWACFARRYFSCLTPFFALFPPPLQTLVQGYNNPRWWDRELKEEEKPWIAFHQEKMALWLRDVPENWADVNNLCSRAANGQPLFLLFPFYRTPDREIALSEIPRLTGTHPNGNRTLTS